MTTDPAATVQPIPAAELVLLLREELKQHWRAGRCTLVEELLTRWPRTQLSDDGLLDLLYQEVVLREEAGAQPTLAEYQQRFPALAPRLERQFALHQMLRTSVLAEADDPYLTVTTVLGAPPAGAEAELGMSVRQYRVEAELGRGGMGVVYKAHDTTLRRTVALKVLLGAEHADPDRLRRFQAEAAILAQLQHPHIVQIFEVGEHAGVPFFAMEYVAGKTLLERLHESPLEPAEAARLVHLLAQAMHSAHERGVIHRDLKPSNVLLTTEQVPKITDFGLARHGPSDLTMPGAILGTPSYMAPEQALGQLDRIGPAADVYSLGALLFELLTGRAPFKGATTAATLNQVVRSDPPAPRRLQPGVPRDLDTICLKCLHKDPAKRYGSAQALADDLQRFLRGEAIRARPIGRLGTLVKWARREPKVAALAGAVLLITLVGFLAVVSAWQAERRERQEKDRQLYFNRIQLADHELADKKVAWAEELLALCPEPLRAWEWYHLSARCKDLAGVKLQMPGKVSSLAAHPRQPVAAVGCSNGQVVLVKGQPNPVPVQAHLGSVNWLTFTADGDALLSGGEDGKIHVWDWQNGAKTRTFGAHEGPISCLAAHPQESWVASTTFSGPDCGKVFVWDGATGKRLHTLEKHTEAVTGLAFHPAGTLLASASHDKTIALWDCRSGQVVRMLREHNPPIACVAFSGDGSVLASCAGPIESDRPEEDEVFVWDTATGAVLHRLHGHAKRAVSLAFVPGGKRLVTAGWDKQILLWDLQTGQEVLSLVGHDDAIMALTFDARGTLYSGGLDKSIRLWKSTPPE